MSYCRNNGKDSDVYVIGTYYQLECFGGGWQKEEISPVHDKILVPDWKIENGEVIKLDTQHETVNMFATNSRMEMISHLHQHRSAGHMVPERAIERLRKEIQLVGDQYKESLAVSENE